MHHHHHRYYCYYYYYYYIIIIIIIIIISEQRPETLTVDDLKDLRYLECVIKVRVALKNL